MKLLIEKSSFCGSNARTFDTPRFFPEGCGVVVTVPGKDEGERRAMA
jgi:hypothetical protein